MEPVHPKVLTSPSSGVFRLSSGDRSFHKKLNCLVQFFLNCKQVGEQHFSITDLSPLPWYLESGNTGSERNAPKTLM